eukprot:1450085-Pleurochrysis_carterae.AAC.1
MDCSHGMGVYLVSSKMYSKDTLAIRPERMIENVSMRLDDDLYRSDRGQGCEPRLLARLNRNLSLALPIEKTGTVDRLATDTQKELGFIDQ